MIYTVGEMAKILGVPASTLRYYDKEGLLPFVERSSGGIRMFQDKDFEWLQIIGCLKKAGMSLKDIKEYLLLTMEEILPSTSAWKCSRSRNRSYGHRWKNSRIPWIPWSSSVGIMKLQKQLVLPMF